MVEFDSLLVEYCQFIEKYYKEISKQGLLRPLIVLSQQPGKVGEFSKIWLKYQMLGQSPQQALMNLDIEMPDLFKRLFVLGFQKSVFDLVLSDIIMAYKKSTLQIEFENQLHSLLNKYSTMNIDKICVGCELNELSKIILRAQTENADEVWLSQKDDFFIQKYIGIKLVQISESTVPMVCKSIKNSLVYNANSSMKLDLFMIKVLRLSDNVFILETTTNKLKIKFEHI